MDDVKAVDVKAGDVLVCQMYGIHCLPFGTEYKVYADPEGRLYITCDGDGLHYLHNHQSLCGMYAGFVKKKVVMN